MPHMDHVFIFRDGRADPVFITDSLDEAIYQVRQAQNIADLNPEEVTFIFYDEESGDPLYRLPVCELDLGDEMNYREAYRRRLEAEMGVEDPFEDDEDDA